MEDKNGGAMNFKKEIQFGFLPYQLFVYVVYCHVHSHKVDTTK